MKGGEATRRASPRHAWGLGQKRTAWELSDQLTAGFVALWRGGSAVSVAVKLLSSTGKCSAIPSPGGREAEGRQGERVGEEAETNTPGKSPRLSCVLQRGSRAAPWVGDTVSPKVPASDSVSQGPPASPEPGQGDSTGTQEVLSTWRRQARVTCQQEQIPALAGAIREQQLLAPGAGKGMGLLHKAASSLLPSRVRVALNCPPPGSDSGRAAREQTRQVVQQPSQPGAAGPGTASGGAQELPEEPTAALV